MSVKADALKWLGLRPADMIVALASGYSMSALSVCLVSIRLSFQVAWRGA